MAVYFKNRISYKKKYVYVFGYVIKFYLKTTFFLYVVTPRDIGIVILRLICQKLNL